MRTKIFLFALVVVAISLSACGGSNGESSACEIETFSTEGKAWTVDKTNATVTGPYSKTNKPTKLTPSITISADATISPASGVEVDFSTSQTYVVKAQDGTTKTYKAYAYAGQ